MERCTGPPAGGEKEKQRPSSSASASPGPHAARSSRCRQAAAEVSAALLQKDVHSSALVSVREAVVQVQGRALCLAPRIAASRNRR